VVHRRWPISCVLLGLLGSCAASASPVADHAGSGAAVTPTASARDARLELTLAIDDAVVLDRVPMRTARLTVHNLDTVPLRLYLPVADAFRWSISTLEFGAAGDSFVVPEPRPHGYVVTERDFPLLAPGERRTFTQTFTIDPLVPGGSATPQRRPGFAPGTVVPVRWTLANHITRWPGGAQTLDGVTAPLFGGGDIPAIWTGEVSVEARWTVPA